MFKKSKRDHSPGGHQVPAKIMVTGSDYEYTESEVSEEFGGQVDEFRIRAETGISVSRAPENCFRYPNQVLSSGTHKIALWEVSFTN